MFYYKIFCVLFIKKFYCSEKQSIDDENLSKRLFENNIENIDPELQGNSNSESTFKDTFTSNNEFGNSIDNFDVDTEDNTIASNQQSKKSLCYDLKNRSSMYSEFVPKRCFSATGLSSNMFETENPNHIIENFLVLKTLYNEFIVNRYLPSVKKLMKDETRNLCNVLGEGYNPENQDFTLSETFCNDIVLDLYQFLSIKGINIKYEKQKIIKKFCITGFSCSQDLLWTFYGCFKIHHKDEPNSEKKYKISWKLLDIKNVCDIFDLNFKMEITNIDDEKDLIEKYFVESTKKKSLVSLKEKRMMRSEELDKFYSFIFGVLSSIIIMIPILILYVVNIAS